MLRTDPARVAAQCVRTSANPALDLISLERLTDGFVRCGIPNTGRAFGAFAVAQTIRRYPNRLALLRWVVVACRGAGACRKPSTPSRSGAASRWYDRDNVASASRRRARDGDINERLLALQPPVSNGSVSIVNPAQRRNARPGGMSSPTWRRCLFVASAALNPVAVKPLGAVRARRSINSQLRGAALAFARWLQAIDGSARAC